MDLDSFEAAQQRWPDPGKENNKQPHLSDSKENWSLISQVPKLFVQTWRQDIGVYNNNKNYNFRIVAYYYKSRI